MPVRMQLPVETALRADDKYTIRQDRHDLARWQRRKFRFVADEQNALALLHTETVGNMAVT